MVCAIYSINGSAASSSTTTLNGHHADKGSVAASSTNGHHANKSSPAAASINGNGADRSSSSSKDPCASAYLLSEMEPRVNRSRLEQFALVYATYMCFLASRRNYGFWLPSVLSRLSIANGEAGAIGSALEISYGVCSLLNGVLIDSRSPRTLLIAGLLLTALANLCIAYAERLPLMVLVWGFNGAVQSIGWPSVTNVFLAWFPDPAARGAWYSLLSTCQNAGAALVPLVVAFAISSFGWKAALWAPALLSLVMAVVLAIGLYGTPAEAHAAAERRAHRATNGSGSSASLAADNAGPKRSAAAPLSSVLGRQVLLNRALWTMALNYFCVSLVRSYVSDWSSVFLAENKGLSLQAVARCLFLLEAGGFGGSLAAGALSDRLFAGRRGPVVALCSAMLAPCMLLLCAAKDPLTLQLVYAGLGFCAFPVHVLLGLFSREVVPPAVSSSAGGFVKCIAQIGGAFAGYPLGSLQQLYGWDGVQMALAAVSVASAVTACSLWSLTPAGRIEGRHGTVQDLAAMQRADKKSKSL